MTYHRYFGGGPLGGGHHWAAAILFLVLIAVILGALAWAIVMILRQREHQTSGAAATVAGSDALKILDERFARGEIEPDDYKARRDLLGGS